MNDLNEKFWTEDDYLTAREQQHAQQYSLNKGLKVFKERGHKAVEKELKQQHDRRCFEPISPDELTELEKRRAQIAICMLTEKRDGSIKGRMVYNGKPTREWLSREESASPTASLEGIFITGVIDAKEERDVMSADIPNAFIQAMVPPKKTEEGEERVVMRVTGPLVDVLVKIAPEIYAKHVVVENGKRVLYVIVLRAIYGMLISALLWYRTFRKDLESIGFKFNPYDACIANRIIKGNQQTIRFHVDDLLSSHVDKTVNDEFLKWLNKKYGNLGEVTATRGNKHEYLGMILTFENGNLTVDMCKYVKNMLKGFPIKFNKDDKVRTPAGVDMFSEDTSKKLTEGMREQFHKTVAQALFLCKRARPDIQPITSVLCTRVKNPGKQDWNKLTRMMKFLRLTEDDVLILNAERGVNCIEWSIDSAFAVHPDYKSHVGSSMKFKGGRGSVISTSSKQKINTESSTTAELVGVDYVLPLVLWVPLFMKEQGYEISENVIKQDNKSTILLATNGKASSGKRTRALNIRYFYIKDQIDRGTVTIEYCPTDEMRSDYLSKGLQGVKFEKFRKEIMGM